MSEIGKLRNPLQTTKYMSFKFDLKENAMALALVGIWVLFFVLTGLKNDWNMSANFLSSQNITNLVLQTSYIAVLAVGMVFVIVAGHIDLSVGFLAGWCGALMAVLQNMWISDSATLSTFGANVPQGADYFFSSMRNIIVDITRDDNYKQIVQSINGTVVSNGVDAKQVVAPVYYIFHQWRFQDWIPMLVAIIVGGLFGVWQGFWIAYRRIPAFIVTLAGMLITKGLMILTLGGKTIDLLGNNIKQISQGYISDATLNGTSKDALSSSSNNASNFDFTTILIGLAIIVVIVIMGLKTRRDRIKHGFPVFKPQVQGLIFTIWAIIVLIFFAFFATNKGMPIVLIPIAVLVLIYEFIANRTVFGRHVYALGGNKEAARLSGVNIRQRTFLIFVSMGSLAGLSGVIFTSRLNSASAAAGNLFELEAIAAAIIGGTSTMGGEGRISGAILGALIMASLNNGMGLLNVDSNFQFIIKGLILLLAVLFDISVRNRKK